MRANDAVHPVYRLTFYLVTATLWAISWGGDAIEKLTPFIADGQLANLGFALKFRMRSPFGRRSSALLEPSGRYRLSEEMGLLGAAAKRFMDLIDPDVMKGNVTPRLSWDQTVGQASYGRLKQQYD